MKLQILEENNLQIGDILLCYTSQADGKVEEIQNGYAHVAICALEEKIIEASSLGVIKTNITNLLDEYDHIAVLRNNELWSVDRLQKLNDFLIKKIGVPFNKQGMYKVPKRKKEYQLENIQRIEQYFDGNCTPPIYDRNLYFCSELITSAFIHVGIIDESASILINPNTFSPEDIGKDKIFGFFIGYIVHNQEYDIPINDIFRNSI